MIPAPKLGLRYWLALCSASVLGANLGDVLSRELELGYWRGLPVLAALFGGVALAARFAPRSTAWYWLAIILVRAAATNLSDWQILTPSEPPAVRSALSFPIVIMTWSIALACLALRDRGVTQDGVRTRADLWFWTTMLVAGTLGTAIGDWLGFRSGLQLSGATVLSTVTLVAALMGLSGPAHQGAITFWLIVVFVRTWGTNLGDLQADIIGLWQSTAVAAALTAIVLYVWGPRSQTQAVPT